MNEMPFVNLDEAAQKAAADQTAFRIYVVQGMTSLHGELRAQRDALKELKALPQRVTALEGQMEVIGGNGQPGTVQILSERVRGVERFSWLMTGALILLSALIGWGALQLAAVPH